ILIKHQYSIQNKHVNSKLHKSFGVDNDVEITLVQQNDFQEIIDVNGKHLFSLKVNRENYESTSGMFMLAFFIGLIFLVVFVYQWCRQHKSWRKYAVLYSIVFIVIFYVVAIWFNIPKQFFYQRIFSPSIFGQSSLLPSLGHFLFTSI